MEMQAEEVKEIKNEYINDFAPENLQHSKLTPYINEHLFFKTSDFNFVYHKSENETLDLLKNCNFLKLQMILLPMMTSKLIVYSYAKNQI